MYLLTFTCISIPGRSKNRVISVEYRVYTIYVLYILFKLLTCLSMPVYIYVQIYMHMHVTHGIYIYKVPTLVEGLDNGDLPIYIHTYLCLCMVIARRGMYVLVYV